MGINNFRTGLPGNGIMKFILHHGVKVTCNLRILVVVDTAFLKNIGDLLPDAPLGGADGTNALQQFTEVVFAEKRFALLQPVVIQRKPFEHIFF